MSGIYFDIFSGIFSDILSGSLSDIRAGILSDIYSKTCWPFYLACCLAFSLVCVRVQVRSTVPVPASSGASIDEWREEGNRGVEKGIVTEKGVASFCTNWENLTWRHTAIRQPLVSLKVKEFWFPVRPNDWSHAWTSRRSPVAERQRSFCVSLPALSPEYPLFAISFPELPKIFTATLSDSHIYSPLDIG